MIQIRSERPEDRAAIRVLTDEAFRDVPHSDGTEAGIVEELRQVDALTISLVAEDEGAVLGHVAFSPVTIAGIRGGWHGLGPVSVRPDRQRTGIGSALIRAGLKRLEELQADGCVVLGDPAYYGRFGFASDPALTYAGVDAAYFQRLTLRGTAPEGAVAYHPAFNAAEGRSDPS